MVFRTVSPPEATATEGQSEFHIIQLIYLIICVNRVMAVMAVGRAENAVSGCHKSNRSSG